MFNTFLCPMYLVKLTVEYLISKTRILVLYKTTLIKDLLKRMTPKLNHPWQQFAKILQEKYVLPANSGFASPKTFV